MGKTKVINYKGINIFYTDFSNTKTEQEIKSIIDECINYIRNQPLNSIIAITNMKNMYFNKTVASRFTKFVKENKPYMKKSAVFGMSGIARVVFNSIMKLAERDVRSFETEEQAKNFLLE